MINNNGRGEKNSNKQPLITLTQFSLVIYIELETAGNNNNNNITRSFYCSFFGYFCFIISLCSSYFFLYNVDDDFDVDIGFIDRYILEIID